MEKEDIIQRLPYSEPFLFINRLEEISKDGVVGTYTFEPEAFFYKGHFKDKPVTPGVILIECMAQIGLVCLGIYLEGGTANHQAQIAMSSSNVDFFRKVLPGEEVRVVSSLVYFRFNKLKCRVEMKNSDGELVCKGEIAGMLKK